MASTMKAAVVTSCANPIPITIETVPIPTPIPGSVVIKLEVVLLPDLQRSVLDGRRGYPLEFPLTPGGNGVGRIHAIGSDTTSLRVGELVHIDIYVRARDDPSVDFLLGFFAGTDPRARKLSGGIWRSGTNAEYALLPVENVHPLNEHQLLGVLGYKIEDLLTIQQAAIAYGGLDDAGVSPGDTVIVAPSTGTFGGAAVLTALAMGANVIACGRTQSKLDELTAAMAISYSSDSLKTVILTGEISKDTESIVAANGGTSAEVYIDFSPPSAGSASKSPPHITACMNALRSKGQVVLMGGISEEILIPYWHSMVRNIVIRGRFMYERSQLQKCIKLAETGRLKLGSKAGKKVIGPFELEQIVEAMEVAERHSGYAHVCVLKL